MPDIGWMELLVIGVVALIVVGPKDLPMMFRKVGQFTGRVRAMAKDFQRAMDDAADETGMTELNRDLRKATNFAANPKKAGMTALKEKLGGDLDLDTELDPAKFEDGSQTRKMAEEKAAAAKTLREDAAARRAAKATQAAAPADTAPQPAAEADAAPEVAPARTGTTPS